MLFTILYTVAAWLGATALFVGVPVAAALRGDVRRLRAAGIANPGAVVRRRFFLPLRAGAVPAVAGRAVWLEWWSPFTAHGRGAGHVAAVTGEGIVVETEARERLTFRPVKASRRFAEGDGAATGTLAENGAQGLLVLL